VIKYQTKNPKGL